MFPISALVCLLSLPTMAPPKGLLFERPVVDAGTVKTGQILKLAYECKNLSSAAAEIIDIRPGCGCTHPTLEQRVIAPGQRGKVDMEIQTLGQKPGVHRFVTTLTVRDPGLRTLELVVLARLEQEIIVEPSNLRIITNGERTFRQTITITDRRPKPLNIEALASSSELIQPRLVDNRAPANDNGESTRQEKFDPSLRQVELVIDGNFPVGQHPEIVEIRTNDPRYAKLRIPVTVVHRPRVWPLPDEVRFTREEPWPARRVVILRDQHSQPIRVKQVRGTVEGIEAKLPDRADPVLRIDITCDPAKLAAMEGETPALLIDVEQPIQQQLVVPIKVE